MATPPFYIVKSNKVRAIPQGQKSGSLLAESAAACGKEGLIPRVNSGREATVKIAKLFLRGIFALLSGYRSEVEVYVIFDPFT